MESTLASKCNPYVLEIILFTLLKDRLDKNQKGLHALSIRDYSKLSDGDVHDALKVFKLREITLVFNNDLDSLQTVLEKAQLTFLERHWCP